MAVDVHYLGEFASIQKVWEKFPNGGGFGDYVTIAGVRHDWNESKMAWGDNTPGIDQPLPEVVAHSLEVQGEVKVRDGLSVGTYVAGSSGANIDLHGNGEFRTVNIDTLLVKDPYTGQMVQLSEFIKKFKTELPPDWLEYEDIPLFSDVKILAFDPESESKYYTTMGAITKVIKDNIIASGGTGGGTINLEIIRSDDLNPIYTDNNVMSALKTIKEIRKETTPLKDEYLFKRKPDTAQEIITFLKGIVSQGTSQFLNMLVTGKITAYDIDVSNILKVAILKVLVQAEIQTLLLKGQMNSEVFASGMLGNGMRLMNVDGKWVLELDKIIVRQSMEVFEIIVQRIRYQGGQVIHSPAGAKLTAVTDGGSYWKCEHDGTVDFITDAQVLCQNFNVGTRVENPDGSLTLHGVSVKRWWRRVTSFGPGWFNLSKTDMEAGSGVPEAGDEVVVLGHRTNPDWQNAILIASTGGNTPYIAHYAGINSFVLEGKEVVREGNLQGVVDADFGNLTGFGLYSNNVYLKGIFRLMSGKTVDETIGEVGNNLDAYKTYVQTELDLIPGKISMEVSKVRVGGRNLLRNYDQRFGMKYWSGGAESVNESGTPVVPTLTIIGFTYIDPITVGLGGTPLYPSSVSLAISDGSSRVVPATWSVVDTSTTGPKTSIATYDLPAGVTGNKPVVSVIVNVTVGQLLVLSVIDPQPVSIYAGETASLPAKVTLNLNDGTTRIVDVTWGSYDNVMAGDKVVTATYNMPSGVMGTKPPITVTVTVVAITILSVVQPDAILVQQNNNPVVPTYVTLNLSNNKTVQMPVVWGAYSTAELGVFNIAGTYDYPQYVTGDKPAVTLALTVQYDPVPVNIVSVVQPNSIMVPVNGVVSSPANITLNLSDGTTVSVPVTWGVYSTDTAGVFNVQGIYDLPSGVIGTKPTAVLSIVVDAAIEGIWNGKSYIAALPGTAIPSMSGWGLVSSRYFTGGIINGTLYMWGRNDTYQLGFGDTAKRSTPTQLGTDTDWQMISASTLHALAIKNGELYAWGMNNKGQLGLGDNIDRQIPTKVGAYNDWTYVSCSELHSFGIRGGQLHTWGHNAYGQLGLYDTTDRNVPTKVGSLSTWTQVSAGAHFGCGIAGGSLYSWGFNAYGQLGVGNTTNYHYPVKVGSYNDWSKVFCGMFHASAMRTDSIFSWGRYDYGATGLNVSSNVLSPTLVGTGFLDLSVRTYHTLATKSDGIYGWGDGRNNEFGEVVTGIISTPTKINSLTPSLVATGDKRSFYVDNNILYGSGNNSDGALGVGDETSRTIFTMVGNIVLTLTESNSDTSSFTNALKTGWVDQKGYLSLNNKSTSPVSLSVNKSGVITTILLSAGIAQYAVDLDGTTAFGIDGTVYEVEVIEFEIGQYGVEPVWYGAT